MQKLTKDLHGVKRGGGKRQFNYFSFAVNQPGWRVEQVQKKLLQVPIREILSCNRFQQQIHTQSPSTPKLLLEEGEAAGLRESSSSESIPVHPLLMEKFSSVTETMEPALVPTPFTGAIILGAGMRKSSSQP